MLKSFCIENDVEFRKFLVKEVIPTLHSQTGSSKKKRQKRARLVESSESDDDQDEYEVSYMVMPE